MDLSSEDKTQSNQAMKSIRLEVSLLCLNLGNNLTLSDQTMNIRLNQLRSL